MLRATLKVTPYVREATHLLQLCAFFALLGRYTVSQVRSDMVDTGTRI